MRFFIIFKFLLIICAFSSAQELCRNGTCRWGECEQKSSGYSCHCDVGVKGTYCDRLMLTQDYKCLQNPCWNNGICEVNEAASTGWVCKCPPGYMGNTCKQSNSSLCRVNRCLNGGVCKTFDNTNEICVCPNEYSGRLCETRLGLCSRKQNCFNGATCTNNACICPVNYTGAYCQTYKSVLYQRAVKILNKGGYTARVSLSYYLNDLRRVREIELLSLQEQTIVYEYEATSPIVLEVNAIAGKQILKTQIDELNACWHLWGTTLIPYSSRVNC